jgi:ornithine carbamoyltransferase
MRVVKPVPGPPPMHPAAGVFSLGELDSPAVQHLATRSSELFQDIDAHDRPLGDAVVGILFTKTSTRTRTAFTVGTIALGGTPIAYGPADLQTNTGESLTDTARVFGTMLDALVARTAGPLEELREISRHGGIPVVNAMAAEEHPTQGVCDLGTIEVVRGGIDGVSVLYLGEGNNTATALAQGLSHYRNCRVTFATPPGYGLPASVLAESAQRAAPRGTTITEVHSMDALPDEVDIVYTSRWQTTGTFKADESWRESFRPFHIDERLMARWPEAWLMHDLPANRGEEVSGAALDGPRSIAWLQARMKLTSAMAVLEWATEC